MGILSFLSPKKCPSCNGSGRVYDRDDGRVTCSRCWGSGLEEAYEGPETDERSGDGLN